MAKACRTAVGAAAVVALGIAVAGPQVGAQEAAPAKKKAAPAKKAANADSKKPQNPWVKLCLDEDSIEKDKDGKIIKSKKKSCYTMTERLDVNTGVVLSSIKLREVEGGKKKVLIVTVPLGMAIPAGVRMMVYSGDQWKAAIAKKKVDEKKLKEIKLKFLHCDVVGCDAGIEATTELIESLKKGAGVNILALNTQGRIFSSPMPLKGFTAARKGKPVDNKKYAEARRNLMTQIRQRQIKQARARQAQAELDKEKAAIKERRKANKEKK